MYYGFIKSSNNREYRNLKNFITAEAKAGRLMGREVRICTDNEVTEILYHKGSYTDKELFEMNLELTEVALKKKFVLKIAHVSGTRMIFSAIDGLSQGEILLGDLTTDMRSQVTFGASHFSRCLDLKSWIASWVSEKNSVT